MSSEQVVPRVAGAAAHPNKPDRRMWTAALAVQIYGVRLGLRSNCAKTLEQLKQRLPHSWKPLSSPVVDATYSIYVASHPPPKVRQYHLLYNDCGLQARALDIEKLLGIFEYSIHLYIGVTTRRRFFIHAGVVGWRGRAIIIPGKSLSGKTTLVASLVRAGATYYSDEFAVFDARGRVHPYPLALSIRAAGRDAPRRCLVESLGGRRGRKPLPVGLIVLSRYQQGATWHPQCLSSGRAVLALIADVLLARQQPATLLPVLRQAVAHSTVLDGVRGEADETAAAILRWMDQEAAL
jgi:hypothetical protein